MVHLPNGATMESSRTADLDIPGLNTPASKAHVFPGMAHPLGPAMHHYRCQNAYISTTASERIVDTLEFFPHNYQMPQLSSTYRLLVAAKDMMDAFQSPHPDFPFASVGDDTIQALTDLATTFKIKLQQAPSPETRASHSQASFPHQPKYQTGPCPTGGKRYHRRQFTLQTSQKGHCHRGWSPLGHYVNHLQGCPLAHSDSHLATCLKTTSA
jgi:hypothetical protein